MAIHDATRRLAIQCVETVTYEFSMDVPAHATDEEIANLAEAWWIEHGKPIEHFTAVEDRGFNWADGVAITHVNRSVDPKTLNLAAD